MGTKLDEVEGDPSKRMISHEEASEFAKNNQIEYFETSAVAPKNVQETFEKVKAGWGDAREE